MFGGEVRQTLPHLPTVKQPPKAYIEYYTLETLPAFFLFTGR